MPEGFLLYSCTLADIIEKCVESLDYDRAADIAGIGSPAPKWS